MALTCDIEAVKDWKEVADLKHNVSMVLMAIGVGVITEETVDTILLRTMMYEVIFGGPLYGDENGTFFTEERVRRLIGWRTNVSPLTPVEFRKQIHGVLIDEAKRRIK